MQRKIGQKPLANYIENFLESFEITNIETDYVRSRDIEEWINENKLGISMT